MQLTTLVLLPACFLSKAGSHHVQTDLQSMQEKDKHRETHGTHAASVSMHAQRSI